MKSANIADPLLADIRGSLQSGAKSHQNIDLEGLSIVDGALYKDERLWVPSGGELVTTVIREVHDQKAVRHTGVHRTIEYVRRYFYWPRMRNDIRRYIKNCHICHRAKSSREKPHGLLQPLLVPEQRWKDIAIDFVTGLPLTKRMKNATLTVTCRLSKERHYISCLAKDKGTSAPETAWMLINHVWKHHGLPDTIVSDRGPQFTADAWKELCETLGIRCALSTAWHPETDGQSENTNQGMEQYLRAFVSYHQEDWDLLLPMAEFAANAAVSDTTRMSPFFLNKGYEPRMSFTPTSNEPTSTRQRLELAKAKDISGTMERSLGLGRSNMKDAQDDMARHANRKRSDVSFDEGDSIWLTTKNLTTERPSRKLDHKNVGPFKVTKLVGSSYRLELPSTMKISDVFHADKLPLASNDHLPGKPTRSPAPCVRRTAISGG